MKCPRCGVEIGNPNAGCTNCGAFVFPGAGEAIRRPRPIRVAVASLAVSLTALLGLSADLTDLKQYELWEWLAFGSLALAIVHLIVNARLSEGQTGVARRLYMAAHAVSVFCLMLFVVVILVPVFRKSRERELQGDRFSQAKRLAMAMQCYQEDNNGYLPGWMRGADGRSYHNVWDRQIDPYVEHKSAWCDGLGRGTRSPSQSPPRNRVLSFGLNGLLITAPRAVFDGTADWTRPRICRPDKDLLKPGETILIAELATEDPMPGIYADPRTPYHSLQGSASPAYLKALTQWIDIDPRNWVETKGPLDSYDDRTRDASKGMARGHDTYGGIYVYCDGHVASRLPEEAVSGARFSEDQGRWVSRDEGRPVVLPGDNWDAAKPSISANQWYPRWKKRPVR